MASPRVMRKPQRPAKRRTGLVLLTLALILLLGFVFYQLFRPRPAGVINEVETYLEDDSLWLPDAVVKSPAQILEMKFGN